ncbi:uncharacterized protein LY89DRAFT_676844 [Mollisia scopiformis]|uniref:Uncharacterized protein n=1 Tax=Mollisia scopiformis TaxID=149040 RepID=A0A132B975_MOLSC|nr:uncharacterized protein LY89DRAFT_676844 [Mollisia scopiformis]KUJ08424.1 hypothetical protein LY89DRAFT_676844 [Mollisia scopiformis]
MGTTTCTMIHVTICRALVYIGSLELVRCRPCDEKEEEERAITTTPSSSLGGCYRAHQACHQICSAAPSKPPPAPAQPKTTKRGTKKVVKKEEKVVAGLFKSAPPPPEAPPAAIPKPTKRASKRKAPEEHESVVAGPSEPAQPPSKKRKADPKGKGKAVELPGEGEKQPGEMSTVKADSVLTSPSAPVSALKTRSGRALSNKGKGKEVAAPPMKPYAEAAASAMASSVSADENGEKNEVRPSSSRFPVLGADEAPSPTLQVGPVFGTGNLQGAANHSSVPELQQSREGSPVLERGGDDTVTKYVHQHWPVLPPQPKLPPAYVFPSHFTNAQYATEIPAAIPGGQVWDHNTNRHVNVDLDLISKY